MLRNAIVRLPGALALLLIVGSWVPAHAGGTSAGAGTYGAPFLRIPVGARLMSSPDVVAGMNPDASMAFSNPAFLSDMSSTGLFVSTVNWLEDLRLSAASVAYPTRNAVFSLGTTFLYSGGLQGFDNSLNVVSEESYYDLGLTGSVSRRFGAVAVGAGATYVRQHLLPEDGNGFAFNLGASYDLGPNRFHVAARNFGGQVKFSAISYDIDSETIVGAGRVFDLAMGRVYAGAQMRISDGARNRFEFGVDYQFNDMFTLRAGLPDVTNEDGSSVQGGLGVRYGSMSLEYAYAARDFFPAAHTVSIAFSLSGAGIGVPGAGVPRDVPLNTAPVIAPSQIREAPQKQKQEPSEQMEEKPAVAPEVTNPAPVKVDVADPVDPVKAETPAAPSEFLVIAGLHSWLNSARSEARALELIGILAEIEPLVGGKYRVVVGRYKSRPAAEKAVVMYKGKGHRFSVVESP